MKGVWEEDDGHKQGGQEPPSNSKPKPCQDNRDLVRAREHVVYGAGLEVDSVVECRRDKDEAGDDAETAPVRNLAG